MKINLRHIVGVMAAVCAAGLVHAAPGMYFTENKGQVTDQFSQLRTDIDFKASSGNVTVFIGDGSLHYQFVKLLEGSTTLPEPLKKVNADICRIDVELVGANRAAEVVAEQGQNYYEHYYTPATGPKGALAHTYGKVTYKNIYPQIDWVLYTSNGNLKHEFVVRPGGEASDIKLKYGGAVGLVKNSDGSLVATTPMGNVTEAAPYSYTTQGKDVASSYSLDGDVLSYKIADYTGTLVIDPTLQWCTYYGGLGLETLARPQRDAAGNIYMSGSTMSTNNMATTGAYQSSLLLTYAAYILKMDANGSRQWCTYFYGNDGADITAAWVDKSGFIYVGGSTIATTGITTPGVAYPTFPNIVTPAAVVFVAKFNANGSREWGSYIPPQAVCFTSTRPMYLYSDFDGNITALIQEYCPPDPFMATGESTLYRLGRLSPQGTLPTQPSFPSSQIYSCGAGSTLNSVCSDDSGYLYVAGYEAQLPPLTSYLFITPNAHSTVNAGMVDGFIMKFGKDASSSWGTYFGGTEDDRIFAMTVDKQNDVYVTGYTQSNTSITTPGSFKPAKGPGGSSFVSKFSAGGKQLWGTYGSNAIMPEHISVDALGGVYTTQLANNMPGLATGNAWQQTHAGKNDILITRYSTSGKAINWAGYFGGPDEDGTGWGSYSYILPAMPGTLYLAGITASAAGIATTGTHQTVFGGGTDVFLSKFTDETAVSVSQVAGAVALNIYPNPFVETIVIEGSADGSIATIVDMPGRVVSSTLLHTSSNTINTKQLTPGMYILQVKDPVSGNVYTSKIIKQAE